MLRIRCGLVLCLILALAGCAGGDEPPQLIASYPVEKQIAIYPVTPPDMVVVYNATVEIEVSNVDKAAEKAHNLVYQYGGYLASSQSWYQGGEKHATLVLAVPFIQFESVRRALLSLGDLVRERVSGELKPAEFGDHDWRTFSYITLQLYPKDSIMHPLTLPDWRPLQTLSKAWGVLASILGFLVDIIIWVVVVAGPFVLIGWLVRVLFQRKAKMENSD